MVPAEGFLKASGSALRTGKKCSWTAPGRSWKPVEAIYAKTIASAPKSGGMLWPGLAPFGAYSGLSIIASLSGSEHALRHQRWAADSIASRVPPGLECWAKGPWEASGRFLGGVLGTLFDVLGVSWRGLSEAQRGPGEALEVSLTPLGTPKTAWSAKGGLPGAYGALLESS